MRKKLVGLVLAVASTSAFATVANDYVGVLSNQVEREGILVSGENLKCEISRSGRGYIPYEWAIASLAAVPVYPEPIFVHSEISNFSDTAMGSAEDLCDLVNQVKAQANQDGYVEAQIRVKAEVKLSPRYGGGCGRDLQEELTVTFANGLILKSAQSRQLSGGTNRPGRCIAPF
jgi:hypothetical protein